MAIIAIAGFAAGAVYDAYQQTDGFTDFCQYDILQTLSAGVGGAAAASMTAIMVVSGVGLVGMGLQGVALGLSSIGISAGVSTSLFIAGTTTVSWAGLAMAWLFTSNSWSTTTTGIPTQKPSNSSNVRSPNGRKGGPAHQAEIESITKSLENDNIKFTKEFKIDTPGGNLQYRFADVAALDSDDNPIAFFQIGKATTTNIPVARERRAITDIFEFGGYDVPIIFIPYN